MKEVSYSEARRNLSSILSSVCEDNIAIYISRKNGDRAVIVSLSEYESMDETSYLMRSKANKNHLQKSIKQANKGKLFPLEELTK